MSDIRFSISSLKKGENGFRTHDSLDALLFICCSLSSLIREILSNEFMDRNSNSSSSLIESPTDISDGALDTDDRVGDILFPFRIKDTRGLTCLDAEQHKFPSTLFKIFHFG
jgi:hypothetical protein